MSAPSDRGIRSYRPGTWFGIVGDSVTVLLPSTERDRVAPLWELVDGGAGVEEVLDALLGSGLRRLPGFALVGETEAGSRILLRGGVRATVTVDGEPHELAGPADATWVERSFTGVTGTVLAVTEDGDPGPGPELRFDTGLVRLARVAWASYDVGQELAADPDDDTADDTADHDGLTRTGAWDPARFARQQPGIPGQPPAPEVTARPVARLALSTGETIDVDRVLVVGRAPEARRFSSTQQPRLVSVPSPQHEISGTHLEIRPGSGADHGAAVVTDLGSTNGTVIVQPGLPPEDLRAGVAVQLAPGAVIDLGDGLTIKVSGL